ncbi:MAG: SDR family oxidoreductase [Actinobacteria bacterium]|nr:SDR family oxidoreductase [Actinomycetota bacterium]
MVGRVALVTGGAGAIGGAIARALEADGYLVVALDREAELACDLSSEAATRGAAAELLERHGRCDVLVHAAAAFDRGNLDTVDAATWRRVQAVNVEAALWLCQELVPGMRERRFGRIVFITSDTVWRPPAPVLLPYITSKAALEGLGRALASALGGDGVTVNCVAPGLTDTPAARAGMPAAAFDTVCEAQALPRRLVPDDVAAMVSHVASERAEALTGQTLSVDGGLVMR